MAQIHKTPITVLFYLFVLFSSSFLVLTTPSDSYAGCPAGWSSHQRNFTITGTDCGVTVKFCKRTLVDGTLEIMIDEISIITTSWGAECDNLLWTDVIRDIREQLMADSERGDPPCTGELRTVVAVLIGQCISFDTVGVAGVVCRLCTDEGVCKKTCHVCDGPTGKVVDNCSYIVTGDPECNLLQYIEQLSVYDVRGTWQGGYNICYFLGCNEFDN